MNSKTGALFAIVLALLGGAFAGGVHVGKQQVPDVDQVANVVNTEGDVLSALVASPSSPVDFAPYWRVWNTLEKKFIPFSTSTSETVASEDRLFSSIEGLVASYKDPYTVFMRPQISEAFKIATRGSLEGIGAVVGEREGKLLVVQPLPGSPAQKAGLVIDDHIQAIDGVTTEGEAVEDAVNRIRGVGGTEVVLTIQRKDEEPRDVTIVRGTIEIPSTTHAVVEREVPKVSTVTTDTTTPEVTGSTTASTEPVEMEKKDFYFLRLFSFSQTSVASFERELMDFKESGANSLIIDLRGNPGGYLEAAVQMAAWFLPEGTVVLREFRGPEKTEIVHRAQGRNIFGDTPPKIAIVVDKASASASEILAGALQEHGVAKLVGTNTYGKGSVQELVNITDELALKVTVARWYTPNGVSISPGGLTPDIKVDVENASSSDPFVEAAVDYLSGV